MHDIPSKDAIGAYYNNNSSIQIVRTHLIYDLTKQKTESNLFDEDITRTNAAWHSCPKVFHSQALIRITRNIKDLVKYIKYGDTVMFNRDENTALQS